MTDHTSPLLSLGQGSGAIHSHDGKTWLPGAGAVHNANNGSEAIRILRKLAEGDRRAQQVEAGAVDHTNGRDFNQAWDEAHAFLAIFEEGGSA